MRTLGRPRSSAFSVCPRPPWICQERGYKWFEITETMQKKGALTLGGTTTLTPKEGSLYLLASTLKWRTASTKMPPLLPITLHTGAPFAAHGGSLGYCTCAQEVISTKHRKKMARQWPKRPQVPLCHKERNAKMTCG